MSEKLFQPKSISFDDFLSSKLDNEDQLHISKRSEDSFSVDCFAVLRKKSKYLICLIPSAQPQHSAPQNPIFHRWSWAYQLREYSVISLSDPALHDCDIHASWFLSNKEEVDYIDRMSEFVCDISKKIKVSYKDIIFYGSSMGGFGALMMASKVEGALAIAEVPQINLTDYKHRNALHKIESLILGGQSLESYGSKFPERVGVVARFKKENYIPPFKIVTNSTDEEYESHINFMHDLSPMRDTARKVGCIDLKISPGPIGHKPLSTVNAVTIIRSAICEGWSTHENESPVSGTQESAQTKSHETNTDYKTLLACAIDKLTQVRYIRDHDDTLLYEEAKSLFLKAADLNRNADWPYLQICKMTKLWTNSFNTDLLEAALAAYQRKKTLEAFIYICRGYLYNFDRRKSWELIEDLMRFSDDPQVANVGNIFLAILSYDDGDYQCYQDLISLFKNKKAMEFDPYIVTPVSTVYVGPKIASIDDVGVEKISLLSTIISAPEFDMRPRGCIISVSCDEKYFKEYGDYLIRSFLLTNKHEEVLHIAVISSNSSEINNKISSFGSKNIFCSVIDLDVNENVGPAASLLRFSFVYPLLEKYQIPVIVLDLDTVIRNSLIGLVDAYAHVDIGSRILGGGVAPWEKYTGGFALFNPTRLGKAVAYNLGKVAETMCRNDKKQWWIDQNCFEAGIRMVAAEDNSLLIENLFNVRDKYCVMPVGSGDSKKYSLERALKAIGEN